MAIVQTPPRPASHAPAPGARDTAIDLLRALCVTGVVLLHAIMVGVTVTDAGPVFANASEGSWWIVPVSWALQVMPLFFVIGGFAGSLSYQRLRERGGTASDFVAARIHRLLLPAAVAVAMIGMALAALHLVGVPADLVEIAGFRYGQPLWFLAVFLLCQALLPALVAAHVRRPGVTLAALVLCALIVDGVRAQTGVGAVGFLNLAFVWLALQQLGFFLADGRIGALRRRTIVLIGWAALVALLWSFASGVYSPDLIANINPPTGALLLVGVVHLSAVALLRERIVTFSLRPVVAAFSGFVNRRTMTIYLWHMPVLLAMAGASAVLALTIGAPMPALGSAEWWLTRPLWLAAALGLTALVALVMSRIETVGAPQPTTSVPRLAVSTVIGLISVVLLLVAGTTVMTALLAVSGLLLALRLARKSDQPARGQGVTDVVRVA